MKCLIPMKVHKVKVSHPVYENPIAYITTWYLDSYTIPGVH